jgi:hypothetical protein
MLLLLLNPVAAFAQQGEAPIPLYPGAAPPSIRPEPLPPVAPAPLPSPSAAPEPGPAALMPPPSGPPPVDGAAAQPAGSRVFCHQAVAPHLADRRAAPKRYRGFIGIWSDASWTPERCAALIVESVMPDGLARIVYAFGSMNADPQGAGGVLHGTGIIRDGELRFQNSDGSRFAFRPLYGDLEGRLTTPQGQTYETVFKNTP